MKASGFITRQVPRQTVALQANGHDLEPMEFNEQSRMQIVRRFVTAAALEDGGILEISFTVSSPASPADIGLSGDTRQLGLALYWMQILPPMSAGFGPAQAGKAPPFIIPPTTPILETCRPGRPTSTARWISSCDPMDRAGP
ncbi:MAG: hypothetical protein ACE5ID_08300 [Acidobacteriota bacterium]